MVAYLAVDGLTSTWQDHLFKTYNMGICDQVLFTTMFSSCLSFTAAVASGQLVGSIAFISRNPEAVWWILALSVASAVVQLVISFTIKRFGAVVFATIMTTRQFFSVLLSCVYFGTSLARYQWVGVGVVFAALYVKAFHRGRAGKAGGKEHAGAAVIAGGGGASAGGGAAAALLGAALGGAPPNKRSGSGVGGGGGLSAAPLPQSSASELTPLMGGGAAVGDNPAASAKDRYQSHVVGSPSPSKAG
jgi:hypothetical protein